HFGRIVTERNQTATFGKIPVAVDRGESISNSQLVDERTISERHSMRGNDQATVGLRREGRDVTLDIAAVIYGQRNERHIRRRGSILGCMKKSHIGGSSRTVDKPDTFGLGS